MTVGGGVLVIGGGASGMAAAIAAASRGDRVTLAEKSARPGRKLMATGGGRCNLSNTSVARYFGQPAFANAVLAAMPQDDVLKWFRLLGLGLAFEDEGRVYPACGHASAVLDVLTQALGRYGVRVLTDTRAEALAARANGLEARLRGETALFDRVIVSGGGLAAPKLGAEGGAYALLRALGHAVTPLRPGLCRLRVDAARVRALRGVRVPACLSLTDARGAWLDSAEGEVLFAEGAVSGICAMQLSRAAGACLASGGAPVLRVDFAPALGVVPARFSHGEPPRSHAPRVEALLRARAARGVTGLAGLLPERLAGLFADAPRGQPPERQHARSSEHAAHSTADFGALARALCAYALPVTALDDYDGAQVTVGGANTDQFIPDTLASRLVPGLHATGETLNVDGDCGGYNLLFAWATGLLAGYNGRARR